MRWLWNLLFGKKELGEEKAKKAPFEVTRHEQSEPRVYRLCPSNCPPLGFEGRLLGTAWWESDCYLRRPKDKEWRDTLDLYQLDMGYIAHVTHPQGDSVVGAAGLAADLYVVSRRPEVRRAVAELAEVELRPNDAADFDRLVALTTSNARVMP